MPAPPVRETMTMVRSNLTLALAAALAACGGGSKPSDTGGGDAALELVWSDEFEGAAGTLPDPERWRFDVGGHGWGNRQLEHNTDRPENASLDGEGRLAIVARRESFGGNPYTSARIKTQGLFEAAYGRFEARIQLPEGQGIWPAFWLLGADIDSAGWPACGEIDVMEFRGQHPAVVVGTVHGPGYSGGGGLGTEAAIVGGLAGRFRLFAVDWQPERIRWFVDDFPFHEVTPADLPPGADWVFDHPFFLILNVAVGGWFAGDPDASTPFPRTMLVDYVRVYQRAGE